ncbi:amino acid adenylation domain-containing protein [Gordonia sp. JH63]|uniref:amino acid adenylation domain-containing protein n=1 Tax=Gordonia TaxID=2053 RepID=UPI00131FAA68|nr:amino acid adenylation domain-containing protein [Gordonia sp. JH63]
MAIADYRADTPGDVDGTDQVLPLTAAQRGMWFAESLSPDYSVNIAQYVDIRHEPGGLDVDLLARCCVEVGKLVESPYVRLTEVDGIPMQYVDIDFDQHVDIIDLRDRPDPVGAALEWMQQEYRRPVDLLSDQFIVIAIVKVADDRTFWYNRAHHIIIDGYAALTIMRRTVDRYNALRRGDEPRDKAPATMAEIVAYEESYRSSSRRETDRQHWMERVGDLPERVTLSTAIPSAPLSFDNVVAGGELAPGLQLRLEQLAAELNSSMAVVLTASFGAFLSRMAGTDDIVMSLPVTGRSTAKIKAAGGMLSNVLPIRLRDVSTHSGRDLIRAAQLELTGALRHQRYRSDDIRRDAGLDAGSVSFGPTINMVFFDDEVAIDGTTMEYRILTSGILEDLLINLYQSSPGAPLVVDLHGNPHLYTPSQMEAHHARFVEFLGRFVEDVDVDVADIELLQPEENSSLIQLGAGVRRRWRLRGRRLLDDFTSQVRQTPDSVALVADGKTWTYQQFDALRHQLAQQLVDDGVRTGDRVVVALDRGVPQVVSIYAVLTAGAAYVPVDPLQPAERRTHILDTAAPRLVIDEGYLSDVGFDQRSGIPGRSGAEVLIDSEADLPVYVIFTSGSTGTPKGVEVGAAAVINRLEWMQRDFPATPDDAVLYKTPFTFDVSVWELFWPLQTGASMVIARGGGHRDPEYLSRLIEDERISVLHFVPSMLHTFVEVVTASGRTQIFGESVRRVFTSGEALGRQLADRVYEHSDAELVNLYGPTEAAVEIIGHVVDRRRGPVPIGRPVANSDVYVLDTALRLVPTGVAGELYLAGAQIATGYVRRPGLTAGTFIADPYADSPRRMYRTGDLVRWNDTGELEYLGRSDFQVKIRGQRVELGEIESVLGDIPAVEGAVVVARTDLSASPMLVAYLVAADDRFDQREALDWCRRRLPSHMVPTAIMVLEEFPVNSSGKLDRKALPAPVVGRDEETPYVAPSTPLEIRIVALIEELLGVERLGLRDNIFALGADSLVAAGLASRLRTAGGIEVGLTDIFESRDIGELISSARVPEGDQAIRPRLSEVVRPDRIPLSHPQTRVWILNRLDSASGAYNIPGAVRLGAEVDIDALATAIADVVTRHEPLRTTFPDHDGEAFQLIHPPGEAAEATGVSVVDVTPADVDHAVAEFASAGFDLAAEYPIRARLLRVAGAAAGAEHVLVLVMHHIIGDGASLGPLIRDVLTAYFARLHGAVPSWSALPVQYADFALWQRELLGDERDASTLAGRQISFWRNELDGMPEVLNLPTDRPRPVAPSGAGGHLDTWLDAPTVRKLRAIAAESGVTIFAVFQSALAVMLSRLADSDDIAIGTAVAGRDEPELADLIGMFVNTVVLRTRVHPRDTIASLLHSVHHTRAQALSNADVPFELVVDSVGARRSRAHSPLFQVELVLQHDQVVHLLDAESGLDLLDARTSFAKYDLSLSVIEYDESGPYAGQVSIAFNFARDLFDRTTVERLAGYYLEILRVIGDAHGATGVTRVDDVFRFPAAELETVRGWSSGMVVDVEPRLIPDAVAAQAVQTPHAPALVFGDRVVAYDEFSARVSTFARSLIASGVGPDTAVAVCIPRSIELLVAIHAVVTAGGQYVPLDVEAPAERAEYMIATAGVGMVLVGPGETPAAISLLDESVAVETVDCSGDVDVTTPPVTAEERHGLIGRDHAAYTLFTSGSTGRPKGVTVSHAAIVNRLAWMQADHRLDASDVVLQKTPVTFDVSVWELFWPLMVGARLVIAEAGRHGEPLYLADLIDNHRISTVHFVPSMLSAFVDVLGTRGIRELTSMRLMFTSGEALSAAVADVVVTNMPGTELHNLYGPTEAAVDITTHRVRAGEVTVPIGRPVPNSTTHVLDGRLRPLPVGVPGELYLGGIQLARGYASQGRLTAERFVADPFGPPGARLYRTGDLARWTAAGEIEYLGRNDFQVKLRGQRLELGEIEAALMSVPDIVHAAVTVADLSAGQSLVAYYSPDTVAPADAQTHLAGTVPEYMVPSIWMPLPSMPLNPAGKVDRKALPAPVIETADFVPAAGDTEAAIAVVFADVLGMDEVSVVESFFDLGGNSLGATKVAARLSAELGIDIPVATVFAAPSVRELAAFTHDHAHDAPSRRPRLVAGQRGTTAPLSAVQRGMWLINRADPASPAYNVAMALRLSGQLDTDAIGGAIEDLIDRHESMRTRYPLIDGEPIQLVLDRDAALELLERSVVDVDGDPVPVIAEFTGRGFDVTIAPPLRMMLLRLTETEHILVFVVHHITADGASMLPLATDVMTAYSARVAGRRPEWQPLAVQYLDYTLWQQEALAVPGPDGTTEADRQLAYWADRLHNAPARLELPTDRPRPRTPSFVGEEVRFDIDGGLVHKLEAVARQHNATLFMVMQTALVVLLSRLTTQRDIVIGTPFAGRGQPELDGMVGMFVNTLALRSRLQDEEKFAELLQRVRDEDLADMANAEIPFDTIVSSVLSSPPTSYNPIYQVMFAYQNFTIPSLDMDSMTIAPVSEQLTPAKVDLQLTLFPNDFGAPAAKDADSMTGQLIYATDIFTKNTVESYAQRYLRVLEEVSENPQVLVGDIDIVTAAEQAAAGDIADAERAVSLPDLVARATAAEPDAVAAAHQDAQVTFAVLSSISDAMAAALPDPDSALTTALMSLLPGLAVSGPDALGDVLGELRTNALRVLDGAP